MIFRKFGGSYQYWVRTPEELPEVLKLDPALWAALSVPTTAINTDRKFLSYLDFDANGVIRLDDVTTAVKFVMDTLVSLSPLADETAELELKHLRRDTAVGKTLAEFADARPELAADGVLKLAAVAAKLDEVASGALRGDGILRAAAVAGSGADDLFAEIMGVTGATDGVTAAQLEKFAADAADFLAWAKQTERPQFRGEDPAPYFAALGNIRDKVDEYFRFCELIRLDAANQKRFQLDPDNLPPLDIQDSAAVAEALYSAPLAAPGREAELRLTGEVNPGYRQALADFAELFKVEKLTPESWAELQKELEPYAEYLARAQGDNIGRLGTAKLEACLADGKPEKLRELFARDGQVGDVLNCLRSLEKLILFRQYLLRFINNFVCFKALFSSTDTSMIQAGRLIMDGRTFALTLWIDNVGAHKTIAVKSHLCLIYLELAEAGIKRHVATAVTAGDLKRIYIGKPAFFIDSTGKQYCGKIVDLVSGPISFWQTVMAPFRRLGEAIGGKVQKLTDFSSKEKQLGKEIDSSMDKLSAPPPQQPKSGLAGNSTMLLLAGGLSIAAVGAAASYAVKTVASIVSSVVAMPPLKIAMWVLIVLGILFLPLAINALIQLRRRNLTLFLEAAGWAINLPMRLNSRVSRFFTFRGIYPRGAKFQKLELEPRGDHPRRRIVPFVIVLLLIVAAALGVYYFRYYRKCADKECVGTTATQTAPAKAVPAPAPAAETAPAKAVPAQTAEAAPAKTAAGPVKKN